ncbi:hypothetical protein RA27_20925 [Ruegeria sp. ANG-R]|nr:hypothetical protein RA27_20925 [Ruegeria sp. ANG-R]
MVLPVMVIGLTLYVAVGVLLGFLIGFLFPALSFFTTLLIIASSTAFPVLLGTRFGLQAMDVRPSISIRKLILPATIYGAVQGVGMTVIFGLMATFSTMMISPEILHLNPTAEMALGYLEGIWAIPAMTALVAVFLSVCSIRASLLVPIASASIGRDPDGLPYTPFRHFRASFGPLFALTILSYLGASILYVLVVALAIASGMAETLAGDLQEITNMARGTAPIRAIWSLLALYVVFVLIGVWAFSLQCAGGALGYLHLKEQAESKKPLMASQPKPQPTPLPIEQSGPRLSPEELRAMRKSRQSGGG